MIGKVMFGMVYVLGVGMEVWYLNLDFFFCLGGGLIFDMGFYYVMNFVNFVGLVKWVMVMVNMVCMECVIGNGLWNGEVVLVLILMNIYVIFEFENGVYIVLMGSWDVIVNKYINMEFYGVDGVLYVLDLNFFGGLVEMV